VQARVVRSSGTAVVRAGGWGLSVNGLVPTTAIEASTQFGNRASAVRGPDHAGLFESGADDMLAATLDGARANLPPVRPIVVIVHALLVVAKIGDDVAQARFVHRLGVEMV
jgi:hypothetical protein